MLNLRANYLKNQNIDKAFTLVEMLMALLIVSVILSASLPVITSRTKAATRNYSQYSAVPIGMIAIWGSPKALPDNTWLECNGQAIPSGIEYEEIRRIFGTNLPDYRGVFLRGTGGNAASLGVLQNDAIKEMKLNTTSSSFAWGGQTVTIGSGNEGGIAVFNPQLTGQALSGRSIVGGRWGSASSWRSVVGARSEYAMFTGATADGSYKAKYWYPGAGSSTVTIPAINIPTFLTSATLINSNNSANEVRPVNKAVKYIIKVRR